MDAVEVAPWVHSLGGCSAEMEEPPREARPVPPAAVSSSVATSGASSVASPVASQVGSRPRGRTAVKLVIYQGHPVGITADDISPISFLLGVFAALTPASTLQLLSSPPGPCLVCPGRLTLVRCHGSGRLAPELRAVWPFGATGEELWEIHRMSGSPTAKLSVLQGSTLRDLVASVHSVNASGVLR